MSRHASCSSVVGSIRSFRPEYADHSGSSARLASSSTRYEGRWYAMGASSWVPAFAVDRLGPGRRARWVDHELRLDQLLELSQLRRGVKADRHPDRAELAVEGVHEPVGVAPQVDERASDVVMADVGGGDPGE